MNEIIDSNRDGWKQGNNLKNQTDWLVRLAIRHDGLKPVNRAQFEFHWFEKDRRRDKDNICGGGRKFILDALVKEGILKNDGWKHVEGFTDYFSVAEHAQKAGVLVIITDLDYRQNEA